MPVPRNSDKEVSYMLSAAYAHLARLREHKSYYPVDKLVN
jgi:hypothetical protein